MLKWLKNLSLLTLISVGACTSVQSPQPRYNPYTPPTGFAQVQHVRMFCEDERSASMFVQYDQAGQPERFPFAGTTCRVSKSEAKVPVLLSHTVYTYIDTWDMQVYVWVGNILYEGEPLEPPVFVFLYYDQGVEV